MDARLPTVKELATAVHYSSSACKNTLILEMMCRYPIVRSLVAEHTFVPRTSVRDWKESVAYLSDYDSSADETSEDDEDSIDSDPKAAQNSSQNAQNKGKRAVSAVQLPTKRVQRFEKCLNCSVDYDVTNNSRKACIYHTDVKEYDTRMVSGTIPKFFKFYTMVILILKIWWTNHATKKDSNGNAVGDWRQWGV